MVANRGVQPVQVRGPHGNQCPRGYQCRMVISVTNNLECPRGVNRLSGAGCSPLWRNHSTNNR